MKFAIALIILGLTIGGLAAPEGRKSSTVNVKVSRSATFDQGHPILKLIPSSCYICTSPCSSIYCCDGDQCCYIEGFGCACCVF